MSNICRLKDTGEENERNSQEQEDLIDRGERARKGKDVYKHTPTPLRENKI